MRACRNDGDKPAESAPQNTKDGAEMHERTNRIEIQNGHLHSDH